MQVVYAIAIILGAVTAVLIGIGTFLVCVATSAFLIGMSWDDEKEEITIPRFTMTHHYVLHMDDGSTYEVDEN